MCWWITTSLSGRDVQALGYLRVHADEINALDSEILGNKETLS